MLVMSPAPQQSPIQYLRRLDQRKLKPLRTTSTEMASSQTCLIKACSPASCNKQRSWSQAIVTTTKHDRQLASSTIPPEPLLLRHREARTDQQRVNSHNTASIVRRNHWRRASQTDLTRGDCSVIHPPLMPADARTRQYKTISDQPFK